MSITAIFRILFNLKFLPTQLIYGGETQRSLPKNKFPDSLWLSANEKHFSNTQESPKLIDKVINSYIEKEREILDLGEEQQALLIIYVFAGQMTDLVIEKLNENNLKLMRVPVKMKNLFQP